MNDSLISVIIPAQNAAATIGNCLKALRQQTIDPAGYEIIVVDDGSDDNTGRIAQLGGAIVARKEKGGYAAAARNLGLRLAQGQIVCFTDADCQPAGNWLEQITIPLIQDPETVGVKGIYATRQTSLVARFVQVEYEDKYDQLARQSRIKYIDFYSAAYRTQVLLNNGGFDEHFPNSEDREFSFRLASRGYKMVFQPSAVVYHLHADTLRRYFQKKVQNGYWTAQVVRRFPSHSADDSYTPSLMKWQLVLMGLAGLSSPLFLFDGRAILLPILFLALFWLTTLPFIRKTWAKDRAVALVSPLLLVVRAVALGVGYAWGTFRPVTGIQDKGPTIGGLAYFLKRGLDVVVSLPLVGLFLLVWPIVVLAHPGRSIRRRPAIGQQGNPLQLTYFATKRLNWLPLAWQLLKGEVTLVGPRPEEPTIAATYQEWHRRRLAVTPGLISPIPSNLPLNERIQQELDYISNYHPGRDMAILWAWLKK